LQNEFASLDARIGFEDFFHGGIKDLGCFNLDGSEWEGRLYCHEAVLSASARSGVDFDAGKANAPQNDVDNKDICKRHAWQNENNVFIVGVFKEFCCGEIVRLN
jgi:hypothetical protein